MAIVLVLFMMLLSGCVAQQADLKKAERDLQQKMRQQDEQYSQARARQQEISSLREQELPQLHGELEKVRHEAQELHAKQEDLKHRSAQLELQTKKLEQLATKNGNNSSQNQCIAKKSINPL